MKLSGYKFASSQINLPLILQSEAIQCTMAIPDRILTLAGREKMPHVTIRYGLLDVNQGAVRDLVASLPSFEIKFGLIGTFPDRGEGEVLFVKVADSVGAGGLVNLRKRLEQYIHPEREDWANYEPHMTLAYVTPGNSEWLKGQECLLTGRTMLVDSIMYCGKSGSMHECSLRSPVEKPLNPGEIYRFYNQVF